MNLIQTKYKNKVYTKHELCMYFTYNDVDGIRTHAGKT